ncbi:hypothetical protein [Robertmurraya andreesenii]|uniref:Uncharacterized protein n=1 Tax=Anoxybacillus andreesenii TaxID=1325932 RepID=A0ABT9V976_9BACL|nr:hypothetical protein [Robertmurraya andreesenii]MDQ0157501.1 hypothetical protein [Robertmurraya andreesenii]
MQPCWDGFTVGKHTEKRLEILRIFVLEKRLKPISDKGLKEYLAKEKDWIILNPAPNFD